MADKMKIELLATAKLTPYANNARTHTGEQVEQIARSIQEFGFTNPVLIDNDGGIIAGHGRIMAAERLGLKEVPCIRLSHLTEAQKRAYIIADNKLALNAGWDDAALAEELRAIGEMNFDLSLVGFDPAELESIFNNELGGDSNPDNIYTTKISIPIYEPKGQKPKINELTDEEKTTELIKEIEEAELPKDIKLFLLKAAERHTGFNFAKIAEYYCHCDETIQKLFEKSALVIIDFNDAIENGFVKLTNQLGEIADNDEE